jgi:uncharacterized membrane protein
MLIIWGIFWGAIIGACWPGSSEEATSIGVIFGFLAGLSLHFAIKRQVAQGHKTLSEQLQAQIAAAKLGSPVPKVPPPAAAPAFSASTQTASVPSPAFPAPALTVPGPSALAQANAPVQSTTAAVVALPLGAQDPLSSAAQAEAADDKAFWQDEFNRENSAPINTAAPKPAAAKLPMAPAQPNAIELAIKAAQDWLLGGNTIVRVGLVILFIGLSFLARYAVAAGLIPVELRLAVIGLFGIALLAIGFKKRLAKPGFALALQGAGVAVMYLTVFAAFRLYGMLPPLAAFGLMVVVCGLSCALALLQNSRALAVAAFAGGFAVPILLSTGQGSHVALFSYYTLLNVAIMFIAYQRSWRVLNIVGFVATFGVATAWGALKFSASQYPTTQPFLIIFLLIYVITAVLYARNTPTKLGNAVDSTLVFGTPLVAFGLQAGLVQQFELGTAFSALAFAALYLCLAVLLLRRSRESYRLLIECFIAIGVGFATLAVPLALDVKWTSAVWALEGAGAFWVGMRQARWMPRAFGLLLQAVAALSFMSTVDHNIANWPLLNPTFMGAVMIAVPAMLMAWWMRKPLAHSESRWAKSYAALESGLSNPMYLYGFFFWCLAFILETTRAVPGAEVGVFNPVFESGHATSLSLLSIIINAVLSMLLGLRRDWVVATWPSRVMLIVMVLFGLIVQAGPFWLVVLPLNYWLLYQNDKLATRLGTQPTWNRWMHIGSMWLITWLLARYLWLWIDKAQLWGTAWTSVVLLISAIGVLVFLTLWAGRANRQDKLAAFKWPLNPHASAYYWQAALPLAAMVFLGALLVAMRSSGRTEPLPYIPFLNPTDLSIALAIGALILWSRCVTTAQPLPQGALPMRKPQAGVALIALAFVAINTVWLRVVHHFFGVAWDAGALFGSFVVQTGYAILWTVLALSLMVIAGRRKQRGLWLLGAGLLGLVVAKLILIDLSNAGGAERIVAFIVVGVLMLVVGYFAPLPPKTQPVSDALAPEAAPPTASVTKDSA